HFSNVMLKFPNTCSWNFGVFQVASSVNYCVRSSWNSYIFIYRRDIEHILAIVNELLAKHLCKLICLSSLCGTVVDVILHEFEKGRILSIHDTNALADDFTIDCLK